MLIKLLAFIAVLAMVYFVFFKKPKVIHESRGKKDRDLDENVMVECPKCGVFISHKEAIIKNGQFFCSRECAGV